MKICPLKIITKKKKTKQNNENMSFDDYNKKKKTKKNKTKQNKTKNAFNIRELLLFDTSEYNRSLWYQVKNYPSKKMMFKRTLVLFKEEETNFAKLNYKIII